eukprot:2927025-Prymnesium_polylepis.2
MEHGAVIGLSRTMLSTSGRGDVGEARPDGGLVDGVHASAARRDPAGCERRDDRLERNPPKTAIPAHVPRGDGAAGGY